MRTFWREFVAGASEVFRELRAERNYAGLVLVGLMLPLIFVATVLSVVFDFGEPPAPPPA